MSQQAVKAAIRRATLLAHRTMDRLDADTQAELRQMYQAAALDLKERINAAGGADGNISLGLLRDILDQVKARLDALSRSRDNVLDNGLRDAAKFGVAPITAAGTGMHDAAVLDSVAAMRVADEAVRFVRGFVADDGLQLSDRIWRLDRHARETVTGAIELAVIQGHGAAQAARELLSRGQPVPADLADRLKAGNANALGNQVAGLMTGTGSPMSNALRLMRTEINRAHGEAYIAGALEHPDAAGIRFLLSPQHPEHDICDLHAEANLHGLGAGVYPDRQSCPWPAHPNTLSYTTVVFKDEITDADRAGKETVSEALARMSPEQRQGVLGVNKAKAFDAGRHAAISENIKKGRAPAYDAAKSGGKYYGWYIQLVDLDERRLLKSRRNFEKQIALHEKWIADPGSKVRDFSSLDPREKTGLVSGWKQDIARHVECVEILNAVLEDMKNGKN